MNQKLKEYLDTFEPADVADEVYDSLRKAMASAAQEITDNRKKQAIEAAMRRLDRLCGAIIEQQPA